VADAPAALGGHFAGGDRHGLRPALGPRDGRGDRQRGREFLERRPLFLDLQLLVAGGRLEWFFDYLGDPSVAGAVPETRTRATTDDEEDVTYRATGSRQIRLRTQVGRVAVSASTVITIKFE
jgi:hypothetical protein